MPKKVKVVNVNDDATYNDMTEAVVENEIETVESTPEIVNKPEPPAPKARAKRVPKPKAVADPVIEPETPPEVVEIKPKAKRVAKVKVVEPPLMIEPPVEKPKTVRTRVSKETPVLPFPSRPSRVSARETLYQSLASSALS